MVCSLLLSISFLFVVCVRARACAWALASEEGYGALYKGLAPNIGRGMTMNMGMMACSDQAQEMMINLTGVKQPATSPFRWKSFQCRLALYPYPLVTLVVHPNTKRWPYPYLVRCLHVHVLPYCVFLYLRTTPRSRR